VGDETKHSLVGFLLSVRRYSVARLIPRFTLTRPIMVETLPCTCTTLD
jgi:hypothetical protein